MTLRKILNMMRNSKNLFKNLWNENTTTVTLSNDTLWTSISKDSKDKRIMKKPVDIFEEIIGEIPKININNLDKQIKLVKERRSILKQHLRNTNFKHEDMAINYLKARKKYMKHKDKFKWAITNDTLIEKLCEKYKVKKVSIENFYRNIPKEGVDEIKKFGEALSYINGRDPLFKLIIDDGGEEETKDPILIAASPFGNWWYVLGAWDKEVEIVDKLIYGGK